MLATTHISKGILSLGDPSMSRIGKRLQLGRQNAGVAILLLIVAPLSNYMQVTPVKTTDVSPQALSDSFAQVAKTVEPAVVSIDTKGKMPEITAKGSESPSDSNDIMEFFRRQMARRPVYAVGSGFIVDKSGYIMTNLHVVEEAARITVKLDSGEEYKQKRVGLDEKR